MRPIIANINEANPRIRRVAWGGILAGAITTIAILFLLNLLGVGIGFSAMAGADPFSFHLTTGTIIWWSVSNLVAIFLGGMVAARMAGFPSTTDGGIHGFLSWAVYTLFIFIIFTSASGHLFTGMERITNPVFNQGGDQVLSSQLAEAERHLEDRVRRIYSDVERDLYQLMNPVRKVDEEEASLGRSSNDTLEEDPMAQRNLSNMFPAQMYSSQNLGLYFNDLEISGDREKGYSVQTSGDDYFDSDYLKQDLKARTNLPEGEIDMIIKKWRQSISENINRAEQQYMERQAELAGNREQTMKAAGKYGILLFFLMGIGALAGFFGGALGSPVLYESEEHQQELIERDQNI